MVSRYGGRKEPTMHCFLSPCGHPQPQHHAQHAQPPPSLGQYRIISPNAGRPDVSFHVAASAFPPQQGGGAVPPGGPQLRGMHHSHHGAAPSLPPPHQQQPPPPSQSQHTGGPPGPAPTSTPPGPAEMGKQGPPHMQGQPQMPQGGQMSMNFGVPNQGRSNQSQAYYSANQRPTARMPNHRGAVVNISSNVFSPPIPLQQMSMYTGVVPTALNHNTVFVSAGQMPMFPGQSRQQTTGTSYYSPPGGQQQMIMTHQPQPMYPGYQSGPQAPPFLFPGVRMPGASGVGGPGLTGGASQQVVVPGGPSQIAQPGQVSMMPLTGTNVMGIPGLSGDSGTPTGPVSNTNTNSTGGKQPRRKYALDIIDPKTMKNIEVYESSNSSTSPHSGESSARDTPQPSSGPGAMDVAAEFAARVAKAASEESSGPTPAPYSESSLTTSQIPVNGPEHIVLNSITPPSEGVTNQPDSCLSKNQILVLEEHVSSTSSWKQTQPSIGNKTSSNSKCSKIEIKTDEHGHAKLEQDNLGKQTERERPPLILGVPNVSAKEMTIIQPDISMTTIMAAQSSIPVTISSAKELSPIDTPIVSANTNSPDIELVHYRSGTREQYSCLKSSSPATHSSPRRRPKGSDTAPGDKVSVSQSMTVVSTLPAVPTSVTQSSSVSGLVLPTTGDLKTPKDHVPVTITMTPGVENKLPPMLPASKKTPGPVEPPVVGTVEETVYMAPAPKERREEKTRPRDRSSQSKEPDKIREKQTHDRDKSSQGRVREVASVSTSILEAIPPVKVGSTGSVMDEPIPKSQPNGETIDNNEGRTNQRPKQNKRNQHKKELNRKGAEKEGTEMDAFAESPVTAVVDNATLVPSSLPNSQITVSASGSFPPNTTASSVLFTVSAPATAVATPPITTTISTAVSPLPPVSSVTNIAVSVSSHISSTPISILPTTSTTTTTTTTCISSPISTTVASISKSAVNVNLQQIPGTVPSTLPLTTTGVGSALNTANNKMNSESKNDDLDRVEDEEKLVAVRNEENAKVSAAASLEDKVPVIEQAPIKPTPKSKDGQVTQPNPGEKIRYERDFLMGLRNDANSRIKPAFTDNVDVVLKDPRPLRPVEITRGSHDVITPKFLSSFGSGSGRGVPPKRSSQQGKAKVNKQGVIHVSLSLKEDVKLRETENAWKSSVCLGRPKPVDLNEEDKKTEELYKTVRGILNKLTPQMFDTLVSQVKELPINNIQRLKGVINLVFEKAVDEPSFSESYAQLCKMLSALQVQGEAKDDGKAIAVNFRKLIVMRCQQEFEKNTEAELNKNARMKEIQEAKDPEKKRELQMLLAEESRKLRMKSVGNIRFIGELFKLNILTSNIMHRCIQHLLKEGDEESLECLCKLLTTIGKDLEKNKQDLKDYFDQIKNIATKKGTITSRVRFMLQDVIDLRDNKWVPRRDDLAPTTIDQIQKDVNKEDAERALNASSMSGPRRNDDRGGDRRKNRPGDDGWSLAGGRIKNTNYSVETIRLKQKFVETDNLKFGCRSMFMWNANSPTDNKKDSGPLCSNNSFAALQDMPSDDKKSSLPQSRSGRAKIMQSTVPEKKRTLPSYQSGTEDLQSQHGHLQQSRSSSRDNAPSNKEVLPADLHARSVSANASTDDIHRGGSADTHPTAEILTDDEIRSHVKVLLGEYMVNGNEAETSQSVAEIFGEANMSSFVLESVNNVLEKSSQARHSIGKMFSHLVKNNVVPRSSFLNGFSQVISEGDDLAIDIPKIWSYLAEFIVPLILDEVISFTEFRDIAKNVCKLVAEVLKQIPSNQIPWVLEKWRAAGIKLTDFVEPKDLDKFVENHKLDFMFGDIPGNMANERNVSNFSMGKMSMEEIQNKLVEFLKSEPGSDHSFDEICHWISTNVGEAVNEPQFIRALMTALCESAVSPSANSHKLKEKVFLEHSRFLQKYIDNKENLELQCLYAVQAFVNRLEHPQGLLCGIFQTLWDNNLISSDSFSAWEASNDVHEQVGKGVAMVSLKSFFTSLHEGEDESEES